MQTLLMQPKSKIKTAEGFVSLRNDWVCVSMVTRYKRVVFLVSCFPWLPFSPSSSQTPTQMSKCGWGAGAVPAQRCPQHGQQCLCGCSAGHKALCGLCCCRSSSSTGTSSEFVLGLSVSGRNGWVIMTTPCLHMQHRAARTPEKLAVSP